jgi:hypothetical protein
VTNTEAFFQETFRNRFYTEFNNKARDGLVVNIRWQTDILKDGSGVQVNRSFRYFIMNVSQPVSLRCSVLLYHLHPSTRNETNVCFWCPFFQMELKLLSSRPFPTRLMLKKKQVPSKVIWKETTISMHNSVCPGWQNLGGGGGGPACPLGIIFGFLTSCRDWPATWLISIRPSAHCRLLPILAPSRYLVNFLHELQWQNLGTGCSAVPLLPSLNLTEVSLHLRTILQLCM